MTTGPPHRAREPRGREHAFPASIVPRFPRRNLVVVPGGGHLRKSSSMAPLRRAVFTHCSARAPSVKLGNSRGSRFRQCRARPLRHVAECHVEADSAQFECLRATLAVVISRHRDSLKSLSPLFPRVSRATPSLHAPARPVASRASTTRVACGGSPRDSRVELARRGLFRGGANADVELTR